ASPTFDDMCLVYDERAQPRIQTEMFILCRTCSFNKGITSRSEGVFRREKQDRDVTAPKVGKYSSLWLPVKSPVRARLFSNPEILERILAWSRAKETVGVITTVQAPGDCSRQRRVSNWKSRLLPDPVGILTISPAPGGMVRMARIPAFWAAVLYVRCGVWRSKIASGDAAA